VSDMKPLCVYVLFSDDIEKKYIQIFGNGCLSFFDDELSAETAKKKFPGTDFVQANYYTERQVEQLKARVAELTEALASLRKPWDLTQILGAETRRLVENADRVLRAEADKADKAGDDL
jgi:hypothetical protein